MSSLKKVFSFGLMADLHYMDADDAFNFARTKLRYFRQSFTMLKAAALHFESNKTDVNILLGDVIDGSAKSKCINLPALKDVADVMTSSNSKWCCIMGNHEFYNFSRTELKNITPYIPKECDMIQSGAYLNDPSCKLYYSFNVTPLFRCIFLDGYDISSIGASTPEKHEYAEQLLRSKNTAYANGDSNWFDSIAPENVRYVPFNGGIGSLQLQWLKEELLDVVAKKQRCFIFCHMPFTGKSSSDQNVLWNCEEVSETVRTYSKIDNLSNNNYKSAVVAVISGHAHNGGYFLDNNTGIHHITPCAPVECTNNTVSYGIIEVVEQSSDGCGSENENEIDSVQSGLFMNIHWIGNTPTRSVHPWPTTVAI